MGLSREYPQPVHPPQRCSPARRCAVCSRQPAQLIQEFFVMVRRSWSTAELDILGKAARSALLLPAAASRDIMGRDGDKDGCDLAAPAKGPTR